MIQVGGIKAYISDAKSELIDIAGQAGIKNQYADTPNIFEKFWNHTNIFCDQFNFEPGSVVFILILAVIFGIWVYLFFKHKESSFFGIIVWVMCSYFGWWLLITSTEKAWARRILPGAILLCVCVVYYIDMLIRKRASSFKYIKQAGIILSVLVTVYLGHSFIGYCLNFNYDSKANIVAMAEEMKQINESEDVKFYGVGWWQAPVLAFYSGIDIYNLKNAGDVEDAYLVVDRYANSLSDTRYEVSNSYNLSLIYESDGNELYKMETLDYEEKKWESKWDLSGEISCESQWNAGDDYEYITGVYGYEESNNACWASSNLEVLLDGKECSGSLLIDMYMPDETKMLSSEPRIYIYVNDVPEMSFQMEKGSRQIEVDVSNYTSDIFDIRIVCNSRLDSGADSRKLCYLLYDIKLE
jgi:hypothetical protein